jgi:hypothetical protein
MAQASSTSIVSRYQPPLSLTLPLRTRVQLEALDTLLRQSSSEVVERAVAALVETLDTRDRELIELLTNRVLENIGQNRQMAERETSTIRDSQTVSGKKFRYSGSIEGGLEVHFENSQPLKISAESIERIKEEIAARKGRVPMGAIYSPLMPNSLGEAIHRKYKLSPINLSYVIPLLKERNVVTAFKERRNWYVQAVRD